jgi:NADH:ubiquinone oxidoreductase subunit
MKLLLQILTWWNGQTLNTRLHTWLHGRPVGEDGEGNLYYQTRDGKRRWVIFNGEAEASRVSPDWHGWLHHTFAEPPTRSPLPRKPWEKPHQPNLTGTGGAWHPPASLAAGGTRGADYEAWSPE